MPTSVPPNRAVYAVAIIEGFSTLAVEVIAIRLAVPVVGSSITLTGVMLGVVLFALSAGYWRGGALSARWDRSQTQIALARNLFIAAILYGAVAFPLEATLLEHSLDFGLPLPVAIGATATLLFLVPIYLASQTVPMLAELINSEGKAGKSSGKVLFFSTMGSVAGGVITPVWLFPAIGVERSTYVVSAMLAAIAATMAIGRIRVIKAAGLGAAALIVMLTAHVLTAPPAAAFAFDSSYQSIRIVDEKTAGGRIQRVLIMSGSRASGVFADNGETSFEYVLQAENAFAEKPAENVLVIGAAGFTFPRDVAKFPAVKQVDAVDVDPVVRSVAETQFLKQPLPPKVRFLPLSARYAVRKLHRDGAHYGFTLVDAYFGQGIPEELVTAEFFRDVRLVSDRTAINVVMDREMDSNFATNLLQTFREANGEVWIRDVKTTDTELTNVLVTNWPAGGSIRWNGKGRSYHDDKSTADRDHVDLFWGT